MGTSKTETVPTTTVVNRDPWSAQQDPLKLGFERARGFLDQPLQFYPNSTVVPFSPQTESALGLAETRARAGSPLLRGAQGEMGKTIAGDYLMAGNPYFDKMFDTAARPVVRNYMEAVAPGIDARFGAAGRYGSGLHALSQQGSQEALGRALSDMSGGMAYQNYQAERSRMAPAAMAAPALAEADYSDIGRLQQVGATREAQGGAELQEAINRFMQAQISPRDALREYMALVGGGQFGGSQTTQATEPIYRNPTAELLGAGAGTAGILGSLFGGQGVWPGALRF